MRPRVVGSVPLRDSCGNDISVIFPSKHLIPFHLDAEPMQTLVLGTSFVHDQLLCGWLNAVAAIKSQIGPSCSATIKYRAIRL